MRRFVVYTVALPLIATAGSPARTAGDAPTMTATAAPAPTATPVTGTAPSGQPTEVFGEIPDSLAGTWLLISSVKANGGYTNSWRGLRFGKTDGRWWAEELRGTAPQEFNAALMAAEERHEAWEPGADTLRAARAILPSLAPRPEQKRPGKILLRAPDFLRASETAETLESPAKFSVDLLTTAETKDARGRKTAATGWSYYAHEVTRDRVAGRLMIGQVAGVGNILKVPLSFQGSFRMYRLE